MDSQKIIEAARRRYADACGAAHALDLVGERWALLVIRELMFGPRRFGELRAGLPGISANVLTQRLEGLEASGVLVRRKLPPPASVQVYELTEWGYEAEPIFQALGRWATRSPHHDPTLPFSAASLMLSFRTMIDRTRATPMRIGFRINVEDYRAAVDGDGIAITRSAEGTPEATFTASAEVMAAAVYGGVPFADLEAAGALRIEGDRSVAERFVTLFPLPPKI